MKRLLVGLLVLAAACSGSNTDADVTTVPIDVVWDMDVNPDAVEADQFDNSQDTADSDAAINDDEFTTDLDDVSHEPGPVCYPSCPYPEGFGCLGHLSRTSPDSTDFHASVAVLYPGTTRAPVSGLSVMFCAFHDLDCLAPIAQGLTDLDGVVELDVLVNADGFDGYFDIRGESWFPDTLYFFGFAGGFETIAQLGGEVTAYVFAELDLRGVQAGLPSFKPDDTGGTLAVRTGNCLDTPASGVSIASDASDGSTIVGYSRHGIPLTHVGATEVDGVGYLLNHPTGIAVISATAGSDNTFIGQQSVIVRRDSVSFVHLAPSPAPAN